jgi:hypothetical protein
MKYFDLCGKIDSECNEGGIGRDNGQNMWGDTSNIFLEIETFPSSLRRPRSWSAILQCMLFSGSDLFV